MAWFFYAAATSICWGLGYAIIQKLVHNGISATMTMLIYASFSIPIYIGIGSYTGSLKSSLSILQSNKELIYLSIAMGLIFAFGNLFIMTSIQLKNATLANIIEITYPLFTVLFTWIILKEFHLNWSMAVGIALILSGVVIILYKS